MKSILLSLGAALLVLAAQAADLGESAAELKIAKWVKGEPVQISDGGDKHIYVVEFWATWCPPCRTSIPHLTEIQNRFKDKNVTIIGITDEKESTVKPFVNNLGSKMDYRVAIDEGATAKGYMQAYGINGIPHAFIVQDKKVIWHGHPMAGLDKTLEEVVAGKYDINKAKARFKAESILEEFQQAAAEGDNAKADKLAIELQAAAKDGTLDQPFDAEKAKKEIRIMALKGMYRQAEAQNQSEKAAEFEKELKALDPTFDAKQMREELAMHKAAGAYFQAISGQGESADHKKLGEELAPKLKGNPEISNNIAWAILTEKSLKERDVEFALKVAKQAVEDSAWKAPHIIDTYARALFDSGKKEEAIRTEEKALAAAPESEKAQYEKTLKAYKEGKLPSE
ncbi:MAG TPA: redoxin domain-containing protein [Verrucomicrobiae bacterium]